MQTVEEVIARVLDINAATITDQTSPNDIEQWDSFNALLLVTELEKNFHVSFSLEEVVAVKKVGDIKTILNKHNVNVSKTRM